MAAKIALAGNPNSGKTTLFNSLTGSNQFVDVYKRQANGSIIAPTKATEGEGQRKKENKSIVRPRSHQVTDGDFITFLIGVIRR